VDLIGDRVDVPRYGCPVDRYGGLPGRDVIEIPDFSVGGAAIGGLDCGGK